MVYLENITPDFGSSFRVIHHKVNAETFEWDYHYHPEIEIVFVRSGLGRRHVGEHVSYYEKGDLVLIGSNLPHAGFGYGSKGIHEEIVIQFLAEIFENLPEFMSLIELLNISKKGIAFQINKEIENLIDIILITNGIERYVALINILKWLENSDKRMILNAGILSMAPTHYKNQKRVALIFDFVEMHFHENISSETLSSKCNMTHPAFCNYFKTTFNTTFTDFLNSYRIKKAASFLENGYNVSETSFMSGFESLPYFSRVFKNIKGFSPSIYQKVYFNKLQLLD